MSTSYIEQFDDFMTICYNIYHFNREIDIESLLKQIKSVLIDKYKMPSRVILTSMYNAVFLNFRYYKELIDLINKFCLELSITDSSLKKICICL